MSTFFKQAAESVTLGWLMGLTTVGFMAVFGFWIWWAMSSRNRTRWEADSRLPLNDGEES
jgi:cbb3-type cytochrome oxidase subunit 3